MKITKASNYDKIIGRNIKIRRSVLGIKQLELGEAIGVTSQQIHKYENGSNRIACSSLLRLAEILRVDASYFFQHQGSKNNIALYNIKNIEERVFTKLLKYFSRIDNKQIQVAILVLLENISKVKMTA